MKAIEKEWLSIQEAAVITGLNESTLRRAIESKALQAYKPVGVWRIRRQDLEHFMSTPRQEET